MKKARKISNPFRKGNMYANKRMHQMLFCIATVFAILFIIGMFMDPSDGFAMGGLGLNVASMMVIGDIKDVSDRQTHGANIAYEVCLVSVDQLDMTKPFPKPNGSREVGQIPMASGEKMLYYYAHDIPTFSGTGEKGDITTSGTNTFTIIMGGMRDQVLNFQEEFAGGKFIILFREIGDEQWYIIGSKDRPMIFSSFENKNDKDGRYATWTFTRTSIDQYYKYKGAMSRTEKGKHPADNTTLTMKVGVNEYTIPNGGSNTYVLVKVGGISATDKGRIITLYGEGTNNAATITENTVFILEDAKTWTAKAGSRITFQVFDENTLVEVQGSRVQTV